MTLRSCVMTLRCFVMPLCYFVMTFVMPGRGLACWGGVDGCFRLAGAYLIATVRSGRGSHVAFTFVGGCDDRWVMTHVPHNGRRSPALSNTERQRLFRARNPGYYARLQAARRQVNPVQVAALVREAMLRAEQKLAAAAKPWPSEDEAVGVLFDPHNV